jgi:hypothetical protein
MKRHALLRAAPLLAFLAGCGGKAVTDVVTAFDAGTIHDRCVHAA